MEDEPYDVEPIPSLPLNDFKTSLFRIASKVNELVRERNKNHGKKNRPSLAQFMPDNKTNAHENDCVTWALVPASPAPTRPSAVYLALFTVNPAETGTATGEVAAANGYNRVQVVFGPPSNGVVSNSAQIQLPASTGPWGNLTHAAVCRSNVRGTADLLYYGPLVSAVNINGAGLQLTFPPGNITVSEKGLASGLSGTLQGVGSLTGAMTLITPGSPEIIIEGNWVRLRGTGGTVRSDLAVALVEGDLFDTNIASVKVEFNGTEVPAYVEGRGLFPDGSYRTCLVQANITLATGQSLPGRIIIDSTPTQARLTKQALPYDRNLNDPRLAGYPEIGFWPSDVDYLISTRFTGETISVADGMALGGRYEVYEKRWLDLFQWWFNNNTSGGVYGLAPTTPCPTAYANIHIGNTNYNGFDLSNPADDFGTWRNSVGATPNGVNYYDWANICITWAYRTGDIQYLKAGLSLAWHTATQWLAFLSPQYSVNGFAAVPEGLGAHYLMTGNDIGKTAVDGMNSRFYEQVPGYMGPFGFGYGAAETDPPGTESGIEGRETGRALLCAVVGDRIGSTYLDYADLATQVLNKVLVTPGTNTFIRADGSFRNRRCNDSAGLYENLLFNAILCDSFVKYYKGINADARIVTAIKNFLDHIYPDLFDFWNYSFDGVTFETAVAKSFRTSFDNCCACLDAPIPNNGAANDLTLMYPHLFSFYYQQTANLTYKTRGEDVFSEGVGVNMGQGDGPTMDETHLGSLKTFREAHTFSFQHLAYRL